MASEYDNIRSPYPGMMSPDAYAYSQELRDPESFASKALAVPGKLAALSAAASTGNVEEAKALYDDITGFYAAHSDDMARAMALNPREHPLLSAVQRSAAIGMGREYDAVTVATPQGAVSLGSMFGPNGSYQRMTAQGLMRTAGFSDEVANAVNAGDELSATLRRVVDPVVAETRKGGGTRPAGSGQSVGLAHHIATEGRKDVEDYGLAPVDALVTYIADNHMSDGLAVSFYESVMDAVAARHEAAGGSMDSSAEVLQIASAMDALARSVAGGEGGKVSGSASRGVMTTVFSALAADPDLRFSDFNTREAVAEACELFAQGKRAGVDYLPVADDKGVPVAEELASYVRARAAGVAEPPNNYVTRLRSAHRLLGQLVTPTWEQDVVKSRGNPNEGAGTAAGVFERSSGFSDLDAAGVALYRAMAPRVAQRLADQRFSPVQALKSVLFDDEVREDMARELGNMGMPKEAAWQVVRTLSDTAFAGQGTTFSPQGLERAISQVAFGLPRSGDPEARLAKEQAAEWYGSHLGETGLHLDRALDGWETMLLDPVIGSGNMYRDGASRAAYVAHMKSIAKTLAVKAMKSGKSEEGLSPMGVLQSLKKQGRTFAIVGYRKPGEPEGQIHDIDELRAEAQKVLGKDGDKWQNYPVNYIPVFAEQHGDMDKAYQPFRSWIPAGTKTLLPAFRDGEWTRDPQRFRAIQAQLMQFVLEQRKADAKELSKEGGDGI